jgi:hypothetical protein
VAPILEGVVSLALQARRRREVVVVVVAEAHVVALAAADALLAASFAFAVTFADELEDIGGYFLKKRLCGLESEPGTF